MLFTFQPQLGGYQVLGELAWLTDYRTAKNMLVGLQSLYHSAVFTCTYPSNDVLEFSFYQDIFSSS